MHFTNELYARIRIEPHDVALEVCTFVDSNVSNISHSLKDNASLLLEAGKILNSMIQNKLIASGLTLPQIQDGKPQNLSDFYTYIILVKKELEARLALNKSLQVEAEIDRLLSNSIDGQFGYELTSGDFLKVPEILDQLEKAIQESSDLSDDHKHRIAKRIERVRSEFSKKLTTLDEIYCLAIEAQIVAHKYGKSAALITKAGHLLWETALRTHSQTEGLATGEMPVLIHDENSSNLIQ
ncbi:hypothetical protein [Pseudomonas syringae]|uniref:hypothetical protein n=1 Tax=Pseudomonas syringae TaxID=317 RepID=UPI00061B0899|nr:hypothetical protein [Pseudomonas syringae]